MSSKARKLVTGSILRVTEFFTSAVIGLILMPFIIHSLGDKMYGLWIFVASFLGYYGLLDLGLMSAIQRFVSRAIGTKDTEEENRIANTAFYIFTIIGIVALVLSFIVAFLTPLIIKNITDVKTFRILVLILGMSFAVGFPLRVFSGILRGHIRYDVSALIELALLVVRSVLIIVLLKKGFGIIALALITFAMDISGHTIKYFVVKRIYPYIRINNKYVDKSKVKALFHYSIFTFIGQIADQLRYNVDNLVIGAFIGLSQVTLYSIGSRLIRYFSDFITASTGMTLPIFSQYEGMGDREAIYEKFILLTKLSGYITILVGGTLIIFGKSFIIRWMGDEYLSSYYILLILVIPHTINLMQNASSGVIYGLSKHKFYTITNSVEGITNLILSLVLVKKYGIFGVAIGTAVPMLITRLFIQPVYTCKIMGIEVRYYYFKLIMPIVLKSLIVLLTFRMLTARLIEPNYLNILTLIALEVTTFVLIIYKIGFKTKEKELIIRGIGLKKM